MAKKTVTTTEYTDDIDGGKAEGTVTFGFDGVSYEIDLSKANARAFEKAMALYIGHARKVRGGRTKAPTASKGKHDLSAIREWAKEAGYDVSDRGRVAAAVVEAYQAAH